MKESLGAMVGLQTKEAKRQEFVDKKLLEQHEFEIKMMNEKFVDEVCRTSNANLMMI